MDLGRIQCRLFRMSEIFAKSVRTWLINRLKLSYVTCIYGSIHLKLSDVTCIYNQYNVMSAVQLEIILNQKIIIIINVCLNT